jgi:Flp pilus assembly protein TadG
MPRDLMNRLIVRARNLAGRWSRNEDGVAAIEFAMIVPIMVFMFIGAVELSQAITVDRRVSQVASSTADLVARAEKQISDSEIGDIMKVGGYIMDPYTQNPLQIIMRNVTSSPASATVTKQSWTCTYSGITKTQTCTCTNTAFTLPPDLVGKNDSVVIADVSYNYTPLVFDYFLKKSLPTSGSGTYKLAETIYLKPRGQAANLKKPDNTLCPSPTF